MANSADAEREAEAEERRNRVMSFAFDRSGGRITRVAATNFRSFRQVEFTPGQLTAVVGPNAAGKSSLVDLFRFFSDSLRLSLYTALERRGGLTAVRHMSPTRPRNIRLAVEMEFEDQFRASYAFRIRSEAGGSYSVPEEHARVYLQDEVMGRLSVKDGKVDYRAAMEIYHPGDDTALDATGLALPIYGTFLEFRPVLETLRNLRAYAIVPDKLRELQDPDEGLILLPDGSNAASVLRHLADDDRAELIEMLAYVVPGIVDVRDASHGNKLTLEFAQSTQKGRNTFEALQMSDGTLRLLGLLLALYQRNKPSFVAIEEPEATIHVAALQTLIEVFRARSEDTQIVLTTHSAEVLDSIDVDSIFLVVAEGGHSRVSPVSEGSKKAVREALSTPGELLRVGALQAAD